MLQLGRLQGGMLLNFFLLIYTHICIFRNINLLFYLFMHSLVDSFKYMYFYILILEREEGSEGRGETETHRETVLCYFTFSKTIKDFIFRERGREGEREGEKHQCVVASHMPPLGTWPTTQPCALTGN